MSPCFQQVSSTWICWEAVSLTPSLSTAIQVPRFCAKDLSRPLAIGRAFPRLAGQIIDQLRITCKKHRLSRPLLLCIKACKFMILQFVNYCRISLSR